MEEAGAIIAQVYPGTLAARMGLQPGDAIVSINGKALKDMIEFQWEWAEEYVELKVLSASGEEMVHKIEKGFDEGLGVMFEKPLFDQTRECANQCLFCFVDQMAPGYRPSLYVKDDDYRLSFLQGSFVTLTNLGPRDKERIFKEHLSPLYVSVHATEPEMRSLMLGRKGPDRLMENLQAFAEGGIQVHTQVVLCPGYNDGPVLEKTFEDLAGLPNVLSLAIVPVGLTRFRKDLVPLAQVKPEEAIKLIRWVEEVQGQCLREKGTRLIWLSDEFYVLAGLEVPPAESYEGYPQLENGVGLLRCLLEETEHFQWPEKLRSPQTLCVGAGLSAAAGLKPLWDRFAQVQGLKLKVIPLENRFFGPTVNVTGLLTGQCLLAGLTGLEKGTRVWLPEVMLKDMGNAFIDGTTPEAVEKTLDLELRFLSSEGGALLNQLFEELA